MLLAVAIRLKPKEDTGAVLCAEYHSCDKCGAEYRLYLRSQVEVEDAYQVFAQLFKNRPDKPDLCYNCQEKAIFSPPMMPLAV